MRWLVALPLLIGGCVRDRVDAMPATTALLSAEGFAELPMLRLELGRAVCAANEPTASCEVGPNGNVVADGGSQLLLNDPSQKSLRRIDVRTGSVYPLGRPGQGPGEFRMLFSIDLGRDGSAAAFDAEQRKTIRFDSSGGVVELRHPVLPGGLLAMDFIAGELWAVGGDIQGTSATGDSVPTLLFRVSPDGHFRKAATLALRRPGRGIEDMRPAPPIFAPQELWHFARDGRVLHADGDAMVVDVHDTTGRYLLRVGASTSPRSVTEAEFQREYVARIARAPGGAMGRAMREQAAQRVPTHAAITAMRQLENGQIWIREAPSESGDSVGWVVFQRDGAPVGRLTLPAEMRVLAASDSNLVVLPPSTERPAVLTWATLRGSH